MLPGIGTRRVDASYAVDARANLRTVSATNRRFTRTNSRTIQIRDVPFHEMKARQGPRLCKS